MILVTCSCRARSTARTSAPPISCCWANPARSPARRVSSAGSFLRAMTNAFTGRSDVAWTRPLRPGPGIRYNQVLEAGHVENGRDIGRWPGDQQRFLVVFHLTVVLQQHSYPGRTDEIRLREIDEDLFGAGPDCAENLDLALVRHRPIDSSGHREFPVIDRGDLGNWHNLWGEAGRGRFNPRSRCAATLKNY